jgi:hypothetical protein
MEMQPPSFFPAESPAQRTATLTCPECDQSSAETMPDDACLFFFECPSCKTMLRPLAGDCCVFCSYGDHQCPPKVAELNRARRRG